MGRDCGCVFPSSPVTVPTQTFRKFHLGPPLRQPGGDNLSTYCFPFQGSGSLFWTAHCAWCKSIATELLRAHEASRSSITALHIDHLTTRPLD
jgi:hypothetical protein